MNTEPQPQEETPNRVNHEQASLLRHLNHEKVEYLAFGNLAINKYDEGTLIRDVALWVKPTPDNIDRFNRAMENARGLDTKEKLAVPTEENPASTRQLRLGNGKEKIGIYLGIAGFKTADFERLKKRSNREKTTLTDLVTGQTSAQVAYRQLGPQDLYQNVAASTSPHKGFLMDLLQAWGQKNNVTMEAPPNPRQATQQPKLTRDFTMIKDRLDLEVVLQDYGFTRDTKKSAPNAVWRIYERGEKGQKERVAVAALKGYSHKILVDMNDPMGAQYGQNVISSKSRTRVADVLSFVASQSLGWGKTFWQKIDQLLSDPTYGQKLDQIPPKRELPGEYALKDTLMREMDLYDKYNVRAFESPQYLEGRSLTAATLDSPDMAGRIKSSRYYLDESGEKWLTNTAFPLYASDSRIVSLDIRNKSADGQSFKKFPDGEKQDALWHSNRHYQLNQPLQLANGKMLEAGTVGTIYRHDDNRHAFFQWGNTDQRLQLPLDREPGDQRTQTMKDLVADGTLKQLPLNRLVIGESPIDALSFKQLNPEGGGEHRQYVSTAGQPSGLQQEHIQKLVKENPMAQVVIAQDGDNPGLRFGINFLSLQHPQANPDKAVVPYVTFIAPKTRRDAVPAGGEAGVEDQNKGKNRLALALYQPLGDSSKPGQLANEAFLDKLMKDLELFQKKNADGESGVRMTRVTRVEEDSKRVYTDAEIYFPNDERLLAKVLGHLEREINGRQGQELFKVVRPTKIQKDFNNVLQENKGRALADGHNLKLGPPPRLRPIQEMQQLLKAEAKQRSDMETIGVTPDKIESILKQRRTHADQQPEPSPPVARQAVKVRM